MPSEPISVDSDMARHYQIPQLVPYGTIRRAHGHQGALLLELHSEEIMDAEPEFIFIDIDGIPVPFRVEEMRGTRDQLITTVERIQSADDAARLRGQAVWIAAHEAPEMEEDHLSLHLLLGYKVMHSTGEVLGIITEIEDSTANLLLVISSEGSDEPLLIPFVEDWITDVDTSQRQLTIDCPAELLHLQ